MKQLQILDINALAVGTEQLAVMAGNPGPGCSKAQVSYLALSPTVDAVGPFAAPLTDGLEPFVWLHLYGSFCCQWGNFLMDNFDSTKGEIGCYTGCGHRRSPFGKVYLGRKTYTY
jgi:hypothetical protein